MSFAAYESYKPSGVEWFSDVPNHWQAKRLKTEARYCVSNVDKIPSDDELPVRLCNYTDVYYNDLITPDMELMETTATVEEIRKFGLRVNDVLITKDSEEWSDIAVPAMVAETAPDLVCGYHLAIIRPIADRLHGKFLLRVLQSSAVNQQFQIAASGVTRYGLPKSSIGETWLPIPSLEEQYAIANFLDAQTAKIDTLLAKKRQLIATLKEERSALIARTVTRGLPPDAAQAAGLEPHPAMKDSGINWISEMPTHWEIEKFSREIYIAEGQVDPEVEPYASMLLIAPNHIESASGRLLSRETAEDQSAESGKYYCVNGSVIYSKIRPALRKVAIAPEACLCSADMYPLNCRKKLTNSYLYWLLLSDQFSAWSVLESDRVAMPKINRETLKELRLPIPPKNEQQAIAAYLDHETARIDQLTAKVETAVERLTEYRQALITSAVTGKIDVRALSPTLSPRGEGVKIGAAL